ncbi:MAG: ABC transporter ATP-binding protein, partial [Anaerolineales bacterium]|nr:ABC transporter ATP-binding protein [Anaerolineales bacterium]
MSTPDLITTRELRKTFQMGRQKVHALDSVDLTVAANTFYTVMGPSGSGKSTLLYLLGGLDRPTSGQIHVNGDSLEAMDENALAIYRRPTLGFIFHSFNLIPSLSALENVAYPLRFSGVSRRRRQAIARDLLQRVGLGDRLTHKPAELSGGQQQRVAVAAIDACAVDVLVLDEPTAMLDPA